MLVDHRTGDDAGVFRLDERTALVQTVDFFTPVVDDPEAFGAIAAANALSDVYAMGGRPLTALSIAAFPEEDFPPEWARRHRARRASASCSEAGCALLGGHSVRDPEIKFGYAVTGLVDPERMLTNAARPRRATCWCSPSRWAPASSPPRSRRARRPEAAVGGRHALDGAAEPRSASEVALRHGVRARHRRHRLRPRRPRRRAWPARAGSPWRSEPTALPLLPGRARARPALPAGRPQGEPPAVRARRCDYRATPGPTRAAGAALRPADLGRPAAAGAGGARATPLLAELPDARAHRRRAPRRATTPIVVALSARRALPPAAPPC